MKIYKQVIIVKRKKKYYNSNNMLKYLNEKEKKY